MKRGKTQMNCNKLLCSDDSTIREVMININANSKGIAFIVEAERKLVGIATDGDIRRALLDGAGMNESIRAYMNKNSYMLSIL